MWSLWLHTGMLSLPILSITIGILPVGGAAECCEVPILHAKHFLQQTHYHVFRKFGEDFNLMARHAIISFPNFTLANSYFADQGDHCPAIMTFSQHMKCVCGMSFLSQSCSSSTSPNVPALQYSPSSGSSSHHYRVDMPVKHAQ